jgi:threonyl-tRNA synthetase
VRVAVISTEKTRLSGDVRKIQTTVKPPVEIYVGEREVKANTLSLRIYDYVNKNLKRERISFNDREDLVEKLLEVVEEMESGVRELIGECPRMPVNLSHLV